MTNNIPEKSILLPFHPVQCGYANKRRQEFEANYSHFLIFYMLEGTAQYTKSRGTSYIEADHIILSNCNTKITVSKASYSWKYFYIVFTGSHAKLYYNIIRNTRGIIPISPLHNISSYFTELCKLEYSQDLHVQMQACYLLHTIIHELILVTHEIQSARLLTPVQQTVVNTAVKYIETHYMENLSVDDICQKVSFSKYYFCKLFKEHTGMSPYQYLTDYRVNKSKEFLSYSKLTIHAIAIDVGFKNTLAYSRAFKNLIGTTPSEYRENF